MRSSSASTEARSDPQVACRVAIDGPGRGDEPMLALRDRVVACRACPTMPPDRRRVPGVGVSDPLAVFVGEAPGRFGADRSGVPFVGDRSGALLYQMMDAIGLSVARNAYVTNVVRCNPRDHLGRNRRPLPAEVAACGRFLLRELKLLRPRVVVPLGDLATRFLIGQPISACRNRPQVVSGVSYYPLYHPSYVARNSYPLAQYMAEFAQLSAYLAALAAERP